jgi:hypothetical protein
MVLLLLRFELLHSDRTSQGASFELLNSEIVNLAMRPTFNILLRVGDTKKSY